VDSKSFRVIEYGTNRTGNFLLGLVTNRPSNFGYILHAFRANSGDAAAQSEWD